MAATAPSAGPQGSGVTQHQSTAMTAVACDTDAMAIDGGGRSGNNRRGDTATMSLDQPTNQPSIDQNWQNKTKQPTHKPTQPTNPIGVDTAVKSPASDQRRRQRRAATSEESTATTTG